MNFLKRRPPEPPPPPAAVLQPEAAPVFKRAPIFRCPGCSAERPPYVYLENGSDYCIPCAKRIMGSMGLRPAGKRADDITEEQLLNS